MYVGLIATNFQSNLLSDSLFTYGWIHEEGRPQQLLGDGNIISNGSRFINSSHNSSQANLILKVGILEEKSIEILMISKRHIHRHEELTFWYGGYYWQKEASDLAGDNGRDDD